MESAGRTHFRPFLVCWFLSTVGRLRSADLLVLLKWSRVKPQVIHEGRGGPRWGFQTRLTRATLRSLNRTIEEVPYCTASTSLRSPVHAPGVHRSNDESTKFDESPPCSPDCREGNEHKNTPANARNARKASRERPKASRVARLATPKRTKTSLQKKF